MLGAIYRLRLAAIAGLVLAAAGCSESDGPALHRVSGDVSYAGKPVEEGRILFRNTGSDGRAYSAQIIDGRYDGWCEAGTMKVEITASRIVPGKFSTVNGGKEPVGEMYIPAKYNVKSTLHVQVEEDSNEIPFDLAK
jgi:hypothetical protein